MLINGNKLRQHYCNIDVDRKGNRHFFYLQFCFYFSDRDGWEVERFGYKHVQMSTKLRVLKVTTQCSCILALCGGGGGRNSGGNSNGSSWLSISFN